MSIERIYDEHAPALFAFLLNLLRNEADTQDILQEVFSKIAARPRLLRGIGDERGFLIRMAHNFAIDLMRRRGARERNHDQFSADASIFAPGDNPDEQTFRQKLSEALGELPAEQRAVVHLKLWERLTFAAIADALEIPANTAAARYRYGIDKLRGCLRPLYDEIK